MQQLIAKFGGTSVASRETWQYILEITRNHLKKGYQPVIVCSAIAGASNLLEEMIIQALKNEHHNLKNQYIDTYQHLANELGVNAALIADELQQLEQWITGIALLKQAPAKTRAQILSLGELMLTRLGHAFLNQKGIHCQLIDARDILTSIPLVHVDDGNYLTARCEGVPNPDLKLSLQNSGYEAIMTQGFIASNKSGETVLLGRGGSDTSAGLLAAILSAEVCEIWTDVPGIYSANPHQLPNARLLKQLNYDEAQEIASMGAKVLHPNSISPVRKANIPMVVKYTRLPEHSGTRITHESDVAAPPIKSIQVKKSITLISIDTLHMWQQVGFLADVFAAFKKYGFSVDLLSSSEFNVTVSLDTNIKVNREFLTLLIDELNQFGRAKVIEPCSAVSLVGHHIRTVLPQLGPTLEVFESKQVYLMSLASNDLNLTFVVDESQADKLCQELHSLLIENNPQSFYYSKSFQEEFGRKPLCRIPWWQTKRDRLLSIGESNSPCYVYDTETLRERADDLLTLSSIDTLLYSVKANYHPLLLKALHEKGVGFECVSIQELMHILNLFPDMNKNQVLFTPNFAAKSEYEQALELGVNVTLDNLFPLQAWPQLFKEQSVFLRIDTGCAAGHHKYVSTAGNESKFGIPLYQMDELVKHIHSNKIKVIGLHAHSGSGILSLSLWQETASKLASLTQTFPAVRVINLGGGLGVAEKPGQQPLDLKGLDDSLTSVKIKYPHLQFWLEPGRYFVAECGIILAKVTQCKEKGRVRFIGIETGMNSIIRPSLYGAYHEIVNLTRLHEPKTGFAHIVGPICESGDTLGYDRLLPVTKENDLILIVNAGAYGHCMSSNYNMRPPAQEIVLE